jgi:hypothetical protein
MKERTSVIELNQKLTQEEPSRKKKKFTFTVRRELTEIKEISEEQNISVKKTNLILKDLPKEASHISFKNFIKGAVGTGQNMISTSISKKIEESVNEEKKKEAIDTLKQKKKTIKEVVPELYIYIGLISVGLLIDEIKKSNFQPWDVVSLSESKVSKHYISERAKLVEFTTNSFLRVYPKGTRFDSSNYDPVKSWICGAQLVSLNLQSLEDDFTLINHVFFKLNNETGYILKPNYLRSSTQEFKEYKEPAMKLNFVVLSGIMLQKCMKDNSGEIFITVEVIGTPEDDKNTILRTDTVKQNFLHPLFTNSQTVFSIYEENISFLLIKMFDNKGAVLARSVIPSISLMEGFRNVTLFNDHCQEFENSILIIYSKKC